tara:strand:- start:56216 stop:56569 length:354 start_codon:yes stop_codon:yes gene_type:complete
MDELKERIDVIATQEIDLKIQRDLIREIDEEICILLAERRDISLNIGVYKAQENLPLEDLKQEDLQNKELQKMAVRYHLNPDMLLKIWDNIRLETKSKHLAIKEYLDEIPKDKLKPQ